jgi:hypothetical protein
MLEHLDEALPDNSGCAQDSYGSFRIHNKGVEILQHRQAAALIRET